VISAMRASGLGIIGAARKVLVDLSSK